MIGSICGILSRKAPNLALVDVAGVGYELEISMNTFTALPVVGEKVLLSTHFLVREDAHILYGFAQETERIAFRQLIKVNGLGPKTALAILSTFSVPQLASAIQNRDHIMLTRVPGIGGKTAERLLVDLKDKFKTNITEPIYTTSSTTEVRDALLGLGYKDNEIQKILRDLPDNLSIEEAIRTALRTITKK